MSPNDKPLPPPPTPSTPSAAPEAAPAVPDAVGIKHAAADQIAANQPTSGLAIRKDEQNWDAEQKKAAVERARLENESFAADIAARRTYAQRIFTLIVCWLVAILTILLVQGFSSKNPALLAFHSFGSQWKLSAFNLDQNVILALIGGTTASVLALFAIVAKYFFPEKKPSSAN